MKDVFVSYSRNDVAAAEETVSLLQSAGYSVFWDAKIETGRKWRSAIATNLSLARCVLVLWTPESIGSDWVNEEASTARVRGVLLPFRIDGASIPLGFGEYQVTDLEILGGQFCDESREKILAGVEGAIGPPLKISERTASQSIPLTSSASSHQQQSGGLRSRQSINKRLARTPSRADTSRTPESTSLLPLLKEGGKQRILKLWLVALIVPIILWGIVMISKKDSQVDGDPPHGDIAVPSSHSMEP